MLPGNGDCNGRNSRRHRMNRSPLVSKRCFPTQLDRGVDKLKMASFNNAGRVPCKTSYSDSPPTPFAGRSPGCMVMSPVERRNILYRFPGSTFL